ncbi:MAG: SOS response-associated peptidase [Candidatus Nanohaloarchaea archaeon]
MCGRNSIGYKPSELAERYEAENQSNFTRSYNIAPGNNQPIVSKNSPETLRDARFGFIPEWAEDIQEWENRNVINARIETVDEKKLFKEAVNNRRCLIPSTGFYEWKGSRGNKQPFHITWKNEKVMSFAGIYSTYDNGSYSFAILTQKPNEKVGKLHDRMPVILTEREELGWLDGDLASSMVDELDGSELEIYPVSERVNDPGFDGKKCIQRLNNLGNY